MESKLALFWLMSRYILVNSNDRIIRSFIVTRDPFELTLETKFQGTVDRVQWSQVALNPDAEFVVSGTFHANQRIFDSLARFSRSAKP